METHPGFQINLWDSRKTNHKDRNAACGRNPR